MSVKNEKHDLVTVYLVEEYGYRDWIWETGMTAEELEVFWAQIDDMWAYCSKIETLPGTLRPAVEADTPEGWHATQHWTAHIHMDEDSGLCTPGDHPTAISPSPVGVPMRRITHRGYTGGK